MSKQRVLRRKPALRLERRGQYGQNEAEQPDHSASLGDSITSSTRIRFSVRTTNFGRYALTAERVDRRLAAVLTADVAGYSRLMGADEVGTLAVLKAHRRELVDPAIAEHNGRIVKTCVYRKLKLGRSGGEVRQGWRVI